MRFGFRQLRRRPAFFLTAIAVLALGIGIAGAMFSVLEAMYLRPLPYSHPEQLVELTMPQRRGGTVGEVSGPDARDWQRESRSFRSIAWYDTIFAALDAPAGSGLADKTQTSANLFATLGVAPALGRTLLPSDQTSHAAVAVLSHAVWQRYFQSRRDALGRKFKLNGDEFTVVGVMPAGFSFPLGEANVWTPYNPSTPDDARGNYNLNVVARLRPGVTLAAAQAEMSALQARAVQRYPRGEGSRRILVTGYRDTLIAPLRSALWILAAAVGMVWLIACAAVAGLLLTRLAERGGELAVRAALGASRRQLAAPLLEEGLAVGLGAGLLGAGISAGTVGALRHFLATRLPSGMPVEFSWGVWGGLAGLALLSVVVISAIPAVLASRTRAPEALRVGAGASAGRAQTRLRDALVVVEFALALVLLTGAGLLLRTLYALRQVPLGFATDHILTTSLLVPPNTFDHRDMVANFDRPLLARLAALPGVTAAAISSVIPLERGFTMTGQFEFMNRRGLPTSQQPQGQMRFTSPGYARVFGIPIESGRFFDAALDTPTSPLVMVVNHAFAAKYFPGQSAVGQRIGLGKTQFATIVGVLADTQELRIGEPPAPVMHFALTQTSPKNPFYNVATLFSDLAVRTRTPPANLAAQVRGVLHALEPGLAPGAFTTMRQIVDDSIGNQILAARLLGLFSAAALAIALAGLYGLLAFSIEQRRREFGVRMALGAGPRQILALVLRRAAILLALGLAGGLTLALVAARLLRAYLFHVSSRDPLTLAAAVLLLLCAGLLAALLPARRAAALAPTACLRE